MLRLVDVFSCTFLNLPVPFNKSFITRQETFFEQNARLERNTSYSVYCFKIVSPESLIPESWIIPYALLKHISYVAIDPVCD